MRFEKWRLLRAILNGHKVRKMLITFYDMDVNEMSVRNVNDSNKPIIDPIALDQVSDMSVQRSLGLLCMFLCERNLWIKHCFKHCLNHVGAMVWVS